MPSTDTNPATLAKWITWLSSLEMPLISPETFGMVLAPYIFYQHTHCRGRVMQRISILVSKNCKNVTYPKLEKTKTKHNTVKSPRRAKVEKGSHTTCWASVHSVEFWTTLIMGFQAGSGVWSPLKRGPPGPSASWGCEGIRVPPYIEIGRPWGNKRKRQWWRKQRCEGRP